MFANEAEITELAGEADFDAAVAAVAPKVATLVVTRSEKGAIAVAGDERASVPAEPIERLVDTTGAGDLFAAGFLAGQARGLGLEDLAQARRDRRRRSDPALWRAAREGSQGAGGRPARLSAPAGAKEEGGPDVRTALSFCLERQRLVAVVGVVDPRDVRLRAPSTSSSWTSTRPWPRWLLRRL